MCSKEEVQEVVEKALRPLITAHKMAKIQSDNTLSSIVELKRSFIHLPCQDHNDRILKNEFRHESIDKDVNYILQDMSPRLGKLEQDNAATQEKGRGFDVAAVKTWGLILSMLGLLWMIVRANLK